MRIQVGKVERKAGYLFKLLALAAKGEYVPPAVAEKEIPTPGVLYQYKTQLTEKQKKEMQSPIVPAQEAVKMAQALREKLLQSQKNFNPTSYQHHEVEKK